MAASLTRHTETVHGNQLLRPFNCPACATSGKDILITGSEAWSIHCANVHGPDFAPRPVGKAIRCFCGSQLPPCTFIAHMNRYHARHSGQVSCEECEHSPNYEDLEGWLAHVQVHLPVSHRSLQRCQLCGSIFQHMRSHLARTHKEQFKQPFPCTRCGREVDGLDGYEAHVLEFHTTTKGRAPSPSPSRDERESGVVCDPALVAGVVCDPALVAGDGNGRDGGDDMPIDTTSNTGSANIEAWKLVGGFLSQVTSLGWSDSECLSWMRRNVEAMQSGSPSGCVTKSGSKRSATETPGLEGIKRPRLVLQLDDTDADTAVGEDGRSAACDMDGEDDGSEWGASDDSDDFSDTCSDDDEEDHETLAAVFETIKKRAASKMASRAATQNSSSVTMPSTASFQEPPPPYTSGVNSPLDCGRLF